MQIQIDNTEQKWTPQTDGMGKMVGGQESGLTTLRSEPYLGGPASSHSIPGAGCSSPPSQTELGTCGQDGIWINITQD
jgi:hypothetical protein